MKQFRIAIGRASCRQIKSTDETVLKVCRKILEKVENLKLLTSDQLRSFNVETRDVVNVGKNRVVISTFNEKLESGGTMIIVQAFYPTWRRPNYFSTAGIGKMLVDGIRIWPDGKVSDATEEQLLYYC